MYDVGFVIGPNENGLSIIIDNTGIYFMKDDDIVTLFKYCEVLQRE